ncbi:MAG: DUF302 domain-containing protein [Micrococcaceae bacterium]|uniref:DUF302 domain-containing protein n=2 Tax=unclassified Arthrobacter TaxID=235627 RepID=UPI002651238C|nr:DUF302 domain-containing protein [Micrococcaceae bacterium]MDN6298877.1 DUF302 domain-containing protein [Micrococcaceae bacterium]
MKVFPRTVVAPRPGCASPRLEVLAVRSIEQVEAEMSNAEERGLVVRPSRFGHGETLRLLTAAIAHHGATLFAVIDHAANAAEVDLELPPTAVVIFGNPAVGTPLMRGEPDLALDLPSRVLVREDATGMVEVVYLDPARLAERHGLESNQVKGLVGLTAIVDEALGSR